LTRGDASTLIGQVKIRRSFGQKALLIITRSGAALLALTILTTFIEQLLTNIIHEQLISREGVGPLLWITIFSSAIVSILYPVLALLLTLAALQDRPLFQSIRTNFEQLLIENIRAMGSTLSWSLLLIIPGFYRFIQYSFVNFIVMLDQDYFDGKVDALKKSVSLTKKRFFKVFGIFLLMAVIVPLFVSSFDEYSVLTQTPISAIVLIVIEILLFILLNLLLLEQWESANGTHV